MQEDLVYDVGMNNGDDSAHYLSKGYRVVAIEADPRLVAAGRSRFSEEIESGRIHIVDSAISDRRENRTFHICKTNEHSTLYVDRAHHFDADPEPIAVKCVPIREIFAEFGVPFYLKIDIEGADRFCIEQLDPADFPEFLSFERHRIENLLHLRDIGYTRFKLIDQETFRQFHWDNSVRYSRVYQKLVGASLRLGRRLSVFSGRLGDFSYGSSGPFGEATDGPWRTWEEVAFSWLAFDLGYSGLPPERDWFDVHCTR